MKKRSSTLDSFFKKADKEAKATFNKATGWLSVEFPAKPSRDILTSLKGRGFRWKPRAKRWSAKWTPGREDLAKKFAGKIGRINIKPDWQRKASYATAQALKHGKESADRFNRTWKSMKTIPIGQPILVGHHSERAHRSHLRRIDKGFEIARREAAISEKYEARAERYITKATGENPVTIYNRVQRLEADERKLSKRKDEYGKRLLKHTRERLKIERGKYKASGGIATERGIYKPGDRIQTRYGSATIKAISKKSARVAFDDPRTSIYGLPTDSKIQITSITGKLPFDKNYVFTKIKKQQQLKEFVGKKVTIVGEQHTHHGCDIYGDSRFSKRGRLTQEGTKLFFVEKGSQTKERVAVGKMKYGSREKIISPLHIKEIRPTWGKVKI